MVLTKDNLEAWKAELDEIMQPYVRSGEKFSSTLSDEEWLKDSIGETPQDVKDNELLSYADTQ